MDIKGLRGILEAMTQMKIDNITEVYSALYVKDGNVPSKENHLSLGEFFVKLLQNRTNSSLGMKTFILNYESLSNIVFKKLSNM